MLSISKPIRGFDQAEYYLSLAGADDYYLDGKEPPGFWLGDGAKALGLVGTVEPEVFRRLFRGLSPDGQTALVHNARSARRRAGWDLTWSVPKSVSVAWSQADLGTRLQIEAAVNGSVHQGVRYLESVGVVSRKGEDGIHRERAKLVFAAYPHSTSRKLDPQLHVHCILMNVAVRPDGTTGSIEPKELFRHLHAADGIFKAELATQLERTLNLRARRVERWFELEGVPERLLKEFSKRRQEIEAMMTERGWTGAKAAESVAFATRATKVAIEREALFEQWRQVGRDHGWSTPELEALITSPRILRIPNAERQATRAQALKRLTDFDSHFALRDLTRALAEEAQGRGLGAQEIHQLRDCLFQDHQILPVGYRNHETRYSTPEMLQLERQFLGAARRLHGRSVALTPESSAEVPMPVHHRDLTREQSDLVRAVTGSMGGLHLISGWAGTGKTFAFRTARELWQAQGLDVHGCSLSGKAASGLQEGTDVPSMTLHRLLWGLGHSAIHLHPKSVVLVDEAAMVGTRQLLELTTHCLRSNAKLVLAGDTGQLQSIEAGGGFAALQKEFGASTLTEIQRQRESWARQAVKDFALGNTAQALDAYEKRGLVHARPSPESAEQALVRRWMECQEPSVILGGTNAEVGRINGMVQRHRLTVGQLEGEPAKLGDMMVYTHDRVVFTRNSPSIGVFNGDLGTVSGRERDILEIRLDHGRTVTVNLNQYGHLRLAYALTTHKAQGMTSENAFILVGRMQNREMTYVQASRARGDTEFFLGTEDRQSTAHRMSISQPKELASTLNESQGLKLELELNP